MSVTASPSRRTAKGGALLSAGFLAGYGLVLGFALLTLALILINAGGILNFGFPFGATLLAAALFTTRRGVYVSFVWWIWLFTPEVRRLVDYQSSYHSISPVMLTPFLVTGIAMLPILKRPRILLRRSVMPFSMFGAVAVYALLVGVFVNGPIPAFYEFMTWVVPLGFGLYLMMDRRNYLANRDALLFSVILGLLVIAPYGLYQFYHFPPWDAFWLEHAKLASAGAGVAEQVRLFGPLNSPGPYGQALMFSLVLAIVAKGPMRVAAGGLGFPAFGLSLVRSTWGGWAIAATFVIWRMGGRAKLRFLIVAAIVAAIAVPLTTVGPVADALSKRFATLNNIQEDGSYQARADLYESFTVTALSQPIGIGFGTGGVAGKLATGQLGGFDSGVLEAPYELGWMGTGLLVWAIGVIMLRALGSSLRSTDPFVIAGAGLILANISLNIFVSTFAGLSGLTLWIPVALALGPMSVPSVPRLHRPRASGPAESALVQPLS
jgi:hypothetical protein